jgi:hypothetical protein
MVISVPLFSHVQDRVFSQAGATVIGVATIRVVVIITTMSLTKGCMVSDLAGGENVAL